MSALNDLSSLESLRKCIKLQIDELKRFASDRLLRLQQTSALKESHKTNSLGVIDFRNNSGLVKSVLTITRNSLQWLVIKRNLANTCLLECNRSLFFFIKQLKILITIEMHWILSVESILDVITDLSTSWEMLCILKKAYAPSLSCRQDNKEALKSLVLINSADCPVIRDWTNSTATSIGRDSGAHRENKYNTSRRTSSLSKALIIAIWMAVVVVLEYAMFSLARSSSVTLRLPWESASK